ncbi:MAG: hypothetical protein EP326_00055 [Deltaproteobacteria bacterium]|nr:MAG: hypothetical protein EP326_00055 [Deltaproteobacteria bacterium]
MILALLRILFLSTQIFALPEYPSIERNNELIKSDGSLEYSYIPSRRTTGDGRVNISMGGIHLFSNQGRGLNLFVPEKVTSNNVLETTPGIHIQAHPVDIPLNPLELSQSGILTSKRMQTICDGTKAALPYFVKTRRNPYVCPDDNSKDCYDLNVITKVSNSDPNNPITELWGREILVKVSNPKTKDARIHSVSYMGQGPVLGATLPFYSFFEPLVTDDGKLLVGRASQSFHTWTDHLGVQHTKRYDLMYSKIDSSYLPCDVTGFKDFYPIAFANKDPEMQEYGIAKYPIRDPEGNVIPHSEDLKVTYPWIDRDGDNIFFTSRYNGFHYFDNSGRMHTRYPKRCYDNKNNCNLTYDENQFITQDVEPSWGYSNFGYFGLWSLGKMVLIDGMINHTDYNVRREEQYKWQAKIFEKHDTKGDGWLNFGNGRNLGNPGGPSLPYAVTNFQFFGSLESLFNYHDHMKPVSPRDVNWIINSGIHSQEISFDRQLDYRYMVHIDGNASMTHPRFYPHPQQYSMMKYHDGFKFNNHRTRGEGFVEPVYFQNAAASLEFNLPSRINASQNIRVEPMAHGGINGKGIWLDGESFLDFELPAQTFEYSKKSWYFGIYLDNRANRDVTTQDVITLTDKSKILLSGNDSLLFVNSKNQVKRFRFNPGIWNGSEKFNHLGIQISDFGSSLTLYVNGMEIGKLTSRSAIIKLSSGRIIIGKNERSPNAGFRGWIDDFVMMMGNPSPELKCNEANGFLVGSNDRYSSSYSLGALYPIESHESISKVLSNEGFETFEKYICYVNYAERDGLPRGFVKSSRHERISEKIHFPEKDFKWNKARPDSSQNKFCLSCHRKDRKGGLGLQALEPGEVDLHNDVRRQPNAWPMFMSGNLPKNFYGDGMPMKNEKLPDNGIQISDFFKWQ